MKPEELDTLRKQLWALWRSPKADPLLKALAHLAYQQVCHLQAGTHGPLLPKIHKRTLRDLEAAITDKEKPRERLTATP